MKKFLIYLGAIALMGTAATSCNDNDKEELFVVPVVPSTYDFTKDGKSTVSYDGQNTRLTMVDLLVKSLQDNKKTKDMLENMFAHAKGNQDFGDDEALNNSDKNIKSKVASSSLLFENGNSELAHKLKEQFSGFLSSQAEVFKVWNHQASAGVPGVINDGKKQRRVTAKGYEADQLFKKGIMGGLILDQALNNYLVKVKTANNTELAKNANYTLMEHYWDEAYGYIFGGTKGNVTGPDDKGNFPAGNEFIKYANKVGENPNFEGIANNLFGAFLLGRASIVSNNNTLRDASIKDIQKYASLVVAVRGVHYLVEGAEKIKTGTRESSFHALSEGLGFILCLQFTHNPNTGKPYFSHEEVNSMINDKLLKDNGLWSVSHETVEEVAKEISSKFGFTPEQAK